MVQGDDSLEVNSESDLNEDDKLSYDDLSMCCDELFEKYDLMKKKILK